MFPKKITKIYEPPIKCQGKKTRIVPFIFESIKWDGNGTFYEPFCGSGAVGFNSECKNVIMSDVNPHLIRFYRSVQKGDVNPKKVKEFLELHGKKLSETPEDTTSYYYYMRDEFNSNHDPYYFLFLSRSCFNGLMRFNNNGKFNSPFVKQPFRFSDSYIHKIITQITTLKQIISTNNYTFKCDDWKTIVSQTKENDFVYIDPPYIGRDTTYFAKWDEKDDDSLVIWASNSKCGFAISSWIKDKHKHNEFLKKNWRGYTIKSIDHGYRIAADSKCRDSVTEALIIKNGYKS